MKMVQEQELPSTLSELHALERMVRSCIKLTTQRDSIYARATAEYPER
jgi:hypothetical protein